MTGLDPAYPPATVRFVDVSIGQIDVYTNRGARLGCLSRRDGEYVFRGRGVAGELREITEKLVALSVARVSGEVA